MEEKRVVSESVLKVRLDKVEFPKFCPVCFEPATEITIVMRSEKTHLETSHYSSMIVSSGHYLRHRHHKFSPGSMKNVIRVPTCDLHQFRGLKSEHKVYWFLFTVVSLAPMLLLIYSASNAFFMGRDILPSFGMLALLGSIMSILTLLVFWPRPFQQYFKILDEIPNDIDILLELKNQEYLELFVEMNTMHVSIIEKREVKRIRRNQ